ncbi:MAG: HEAT repeat domain-containing protein [Actinomycetota bacterium]
MVPNSKTKSFDELVRDLEAPESGTRYWAIQHLSERGAQAVEPLVALLDGPQKTDWGDAARALGRIGDPRAVPVLTRLYVSDTSRVMGNPHRAAGEALRRIGTAELPVLVSALRDEDSYKRQEAADLIGDLRLVDASADLLAVAANTVAAVRALGQIRANAAIPSLVRIASTSEEEFMRVAAVSSLGKLGNPTASSVLVSALSDSSERVRSSAVLALKAMPTDAVLDAIRGRLTDEAVTVRASAVEVLGEIDPAGSFANLVAATNDAEPSVRRAAWRALQSVADPDLIERAAALSEEFRIGMLPRFENALRAEGVGSDQGGFALADWMPLSNVWEGLQEPVEGEDESEPETSWLVAKAARMIGATPELVLTVGNLSSRTSGVWSLWTFDLGQLAVLVYEEDEAEELWAVGAWPRGTGQAAIEECFIQVCERFGGAIFFGADDVPIVNEPLSADLLRVGLVSAVESDDALFARILERLDMAEGTDRGQAARELWRVISSDAGC